MPSPDVSPYIDLTITDKSAQDIYDSMMMQLSTELPEWTPRENNIEVLMAEALALPAAELAYLINRLPSGIIEVLLQFINVYRDVGAQPVATLQFDVVDDNGYTIPAGTSASLLLAAGIDPVVFSTDEALKIPKGETSGTVSATGDRFTMDANSTVSGTSLGVLDTVDWINDATLVSIDIDGRDEESDDDWVARGVQRFSEMSTTLTLARQFQASVLDYIMVERALVIDNYNPAGRSLAGAQTVANNATLVSTQVAAFSSYDVGASVTGTGIPAGTVINSITDPTHAVMSNRATAAGTGTVNIARLPGNDGGYIYLAVYGNNDFVSDDDKAGIAQDLTAQAQANLVVNLADATLTTVDVTATVVCDIGFDPLVVEAEVVTALLDYLNTANWPWTSVVYRNALIAVIGNAQGVAYVQTLDLPVGDVSLAGLAPLAVLGTPTITAITQ